MAPTPLSARLRELRMQGRPDGPINQSRVAEALGVAISSISTYENGTTPPVDRLHDFAVFYATARWWNRDAPRRVNVNFLTDVEREVFEELHDELAQLFARGNHSQGRRHY